jgi:hypothetical protein
MKVAPGIKYAVARVGLFVVIAIPLVLFTPKDMNFFLKLMIAAAASAALGIVLLRQWRGEVVTQLETSMAKRAAEKERLRAALAGEPEPSTKDAPAEPAASDVTEPGADDPDARVDGTERAVDKTRPAGRGSGSGRTGPTGTTRPGGRRPTR